MQWNTDDEKDYRVVKVTGWIAVEHSNKLEERAGVYIFADESRDVKYVGKAGAGRILVEYKGYNKFELSEVASAKSRKKDKGATYIKVLYTNSGEAALALEGELIDKYDLANNDVDLIKG